jgi:hypothetical protein
LYSGYLALLIVLSEPAEKNLIFIRHSYLSLRDETNWVMARVDRFANEKVISYYIRRVFGKRAGS